MADKTEAERRKQRLANALRENLKKRKARAADKEKKVETLTPLGASLPASNQQGWEQAKDEGSHSQPK